MINALRITERDGKRIERLLRRAIRNAIPYEQMMGRALIAKMGNPLPQPADEYYLNFDVGYTVCLQVQELIKGLPVKNLQIRGPNETPAPEAVMVLMKLFHFEAPVEQCVIYTTPISDERVALHVLEPVDPSQNELLQEMARSELAAMRSPSQMVH